jgi:hypothetical protein
MLNTCQRIHKYTKYTIQHNCQINNYYYNINLISYFTATCFGSFLWSHLQVEFEKKILYTIDNVSMITRSRKFAVFFVFGATAHKWAKASSLMRFLDYTQGRTTFGRTSLGK